MGFCYSTPKVDPLIGENFPFQNFLKIPLTTLIEGGGGDSDETKDITTMISKYMSEIEDLRTKLCESENLCEQLRKENTKVKRLSANLTGANMPWLANNSFNNGHDESGFSVQELIEMAKKDLVVKQEKVRRTSNQTKKNSLSLEFEKEMEGKIKNFWENISLNFVVLSA